MPASLLCFGLLVLLEEGRFLCTRLWDESRLGQVAERVAGVEAAAPCLCLSFLPPKADVRKMDAKVSLSRQNAGCHVMIQAEIGPKGAILIVCVCVRERACVCR